MTQPVSGMKQEQFKFYHSTQNRIVGPVVLRDPIKFSDIVNPTLNVEFRNFERDVLIDRDVDMGERTMKIAARCIVVSPGTTVRAKDIVFEAKNGYFSFGSINYQNFEYCVPESYSCQEGEFVEGQGMKSIGHWWKGDKNSKLSLIRDVD